LKRVPYSIQQSIPPSASLGDNVIESGFEAKPVPVKRILFITALALINAIVVGVFAKALIYLINFFTNLFFFGAVSFRSASPSDNHIGYWVILIPVIGGIIVGLMARYGSKGIRGHGIPEAMEKILTEKSNVPPLITFLKPLSSAISIGTGGPFGAEGPIIATGGAWGSFCGQTLHTTARERKILLAAGATAGMTAIFGTPFAAILLAIELLLFEFSPKSFIPVVVACVTAACMHFLLFDSAPVFPMPPVSVPDKNAVIAYAGIGLIIGLASVVVTKSVYFIEDAFEKLPVHWMWWPAIGGLAVGVIGYFAPKTLGVGYFNITQALSGSLAVGVLVTLCFWKFVSWAIALGSGTSGGTLAPLLTIGSALGCLLGMFTQNLFPQAHVSLPLAALVGMSALFAGASRALLTAIVFALEATMQENTFLPLIAGCVTSYMVSFVFMRTTIMTEKITRRGVVAPDSFSPDVLKNTNVADVIEREAEKNKIPLISTGNTVGDVRRWLTGEGTGYGYKTLLIADENSSKMIGALDRDAVFKKDISGMEKITDIASGSISAVYLDNNLWETVHFMLKSQQDILPVIDRKTKHIIGIISQADIFKAYNEHLQSDSHRHQNISAKRNALKIIIKGKQFFKMAG